MLEDDAQLMSGAGKHITHEKNRDLETEAKTMLRRRTRRNKECRYSLEHLGAYLEQRCVIVTKTVRKSNRRLNQQLDRKLAEIELQRYTSLQSPTMFTRDSVRS